MGKRPHGPASAMPRTEHCSGFYERSGGLHKRRQTLQHCHARGIVLGSSSMERATRPTAAASSEDMQLPDCSCLSCLPGRFVGDMPDAQAAYRHHNANESSGVHCCNRRCRARGLRATRWPGRREAPQGAARRRGGRSNYHRERASGIGDARGQHTALNKGSANDN